MHRQEITVVVRHMVRMSVGLLAVFVFLSGPIFLSVLHWSDNRVLRPNALAMIALGVVLAGLALAFAMKKHEDVMKILRKYT